MLFEIRGQVLHAEFGFQLLPDLVDPFGVLVGADGQGGGEPLEAVLGGVMGCPAHPQPIADGAAAASGAILMPWVIGRVAEGAGLAAGMMTNIVPCVGLLLFAVLVARMPEEA